MPLAKWYSDAGVPLDDQRRPNEKLVLLAGPPGLGKTTLAHVVAKHCGYRPPPPSTSRFTTGGERHAATLCILW